MKRKLFALFLAGLLCLGLTVPGFASVEELVSLRVDDVTAYSPEEGIYTVRENGLYGYYHTDGTLLLEPNYAFAGEFHDGMAAVFGEAGISVLHDRTLYDYPSYSGAYDRSLASIERYLEKYPSISFVLDVHRDAIEDTQGNQYKVVSEIDGVGVAAQMSLVIGSDGSGLSHPDWMENLKLAAAIQEEALTRYPTLMRPVLLRNSRYNQHATKGSLLVEVGAAGNSLDEALLSARLFAKAFADVIQ